MQNFMKLYSSKNILFICKYMQDILDYLFNTYINVIPHKIYDKKNIIKLVLNQDIVGRCAYLQKILIPFFL